MATCQHVNQPHNARTMKGILKMLQAFLFALWVMVFIPPGGVFLLWGFYVLASKKTVEGNLLYFWLAIMVTALIIIIIAGLKYDDGILSEVQKTQDDYAKKQQSLESDYKNRLNELEQVYMTRCRILREKERQLNQLLKSSTPFKNVASMIADIETAILNERENYFKYKRHPSPKSVDEIRLLKKEMSQKITELKAKEYKYEFLITTYPELAKYIDNDADLMAFVEDYSTYNDFEESVDHSREYLSDKEWKSLSESERNQLALDRYIARRKKSKTQIGRDYEMACGYMYSTKGYTIEYIGIKYGCNDLGRDLIATKTDAASRNEILLIQCKCWNSEMPIRENVVMQLYGSAIEYEIQNQQSVKPILMIPPFSKVSDTARRFAKHLKIDIIIQDFINFPRIKCNINGTNKIYHLPFDQQYNRTEIKNPGEFYAWTVNDAERRGFRRALRHVYR